MPPPPRLIPFFADDEAFDALFPDDVRAASSRFWTPLSVARRVAALFEAARATTILDVGAGPGKLALVLGALLPDVTVVGVEHRLPLVKVARAARDRLGLGNVSFVHDDACALPWDNFDGFYLYNSFAENVFAPEDRFDPNADLGVDRLSRDVARSFASLRAARPGSALVSFYGSSTRVPGTFDLAALEEEYDGWLRLWVKTDRADDGRYFLEERGTHTLHAPGAGDPPLSRTSR